MRDQLIKTLETYTPFDQDESLSVTKTIDLLKNHDRCFWRDHFTPGHKTGSAFLLNKTLDKVLLTHHAILNFWMQFGGHADGDENILNVGYREGQEESGIENIKVITHNIFDIDVHAIPPNPKREEPEHFHYDVCFLFYVQDDTPFIISDESNDLKWFSLSEFKDLIGNDYSQRFKRMADKWEQLIQATAA